MILISKKWRVAIASLDGKMINEHFGRAKEFFIVDLKPDGTNEFIGRRAVNPLCRTGEHSDEGLLASIDSLNDCTAVLVSRIGVGAKKALEINQIAVFEQPDFIEDALAKLTKYFVRTNYAYLED